MPWPSSSSAAGSTGVPRFLEDVLDTPYEELFDPVFEGPLYLGMRLDAQGRIEQVRSPLLDVEFKDDITDLEDPEYNAPLEIRTLADLGPRYQVADIGTIPVLHFEEAGRHHLRLVIRTPHGQRLERLARLLPPETVRAIAFDPTMSPDLDLVLPKGGTWAEKGRFFNETAEFFDPIQGSVGNCYLIAAQSAVAWTRPFLIRHMTRATGMQQQQFTNLVQFFPKKPGVYEVASTPDSVEVTSLLPVKNGNLIYARSFEAEEIWPGVVEKAFAKWKTGHTGDWPWIPATAKGDPVLATAQITGGKPQKWLTKDLSAQELYNKILANSRFNTTINPMTAWTYDTGDGKKKTDGSKLAYGDVNIVADHAYAVLGHGRLHGQYFVILRNPWGHTEATFGTLNTSILLRDISWWRPIDLNVSDGVFALEMQVFKEYFEGLGVAK
jgi:hypothetical protein